MKKVRTLGRKTARAGLRNQGNSAEKKALASTSQFRHRIMSDERVRYLYSEEKNIVHDKSCILAREIPDEKLQYSGDYQPEMVQCPECALKAYIRLGAKDFGEVDAYLKLFECIGMSQILVRHIYVECHMRTEVYRNVLTVWDREDTWKIVAFDTGRRVKLLHNNYRRLPEGERCFVKGFHVQNDFVSNTNIGYAIRTIESYSYDRHKVMEATKNSEETLQKKIVEFPTEDNAAPAVKEENRYGIWKRITNWAKKVWNNWFRERPIKIMRSKKAVPQAEDSQYRAEGMGKADDD